MGYPARNYNNVMVVGLRDPYEQDSTGLSQTDQRLCHGAVAAYYDGPKTKRAKRSILLTGEHRGTLDKAGNIVRDSRSMAAYVIEQYRRMPPEVLVLGAGSADIEESFILSRQKNPEFFEGLISGEQKLGLVSPRDQMADIAEIGSWALRCSMKQIVKLPLGELVEGGRIITFDRGTTGEQYTTLAADE